MADNASRLLQLSPLSHADLLIAAPKITQAVFAALGDFYTWKLAGRVYGRNGNETWAVVGGNGSSAVLNMTLANNYSW